MKKPLDAKVPKTRLRVLFVECFGISCSSTFVARVIVDWHAMRHDIDVVQSIRLLPQWSCNGLIYWAVGLQCTAI